MCGTAALQSLFRRMPRREDERDDDSPIAFPDLPGAPAFPWRQMSALYRTFRDGDDVSEGLRRNYLWNLDSPGGFVLNTFRRLEERYLEAPPLADMGFRRARAVGPLAPMADRTRGGVVCGWNSVLEATAAGVAMLAWPMTVDQFMNARLLVDELLAAVPVSWGGLNAEPGADEVARVLDDAVNGRRWAEVASRVQELADEAAAAVRPGGDSWRELEDGFALVSARQFHS